MDAVGVGWNSGFGVEDLLGFDSAYAMDSTCENVVRDMSNAMRVMTYSYNRRPRPTDQLALSTARRRSRWKE